MNIAISTETPSQGQSAYRQIDELRAIDEMVGFLTDQLVRCDHTVTFCDDSVHSELAAFTANMVGGRVTSYFTPEAAESAKINSLTTRLGTQKVVGVPLPELYERWLRETDPAALICFAGMENTEKTADLFQSMYPKRPIYVLSVFGGAGENLTRQGVGIHTDMELAAKLGKGLDAVVNCGLIIAPMIVDDMTAKGIV